MVGFLNQRPTSFFLLQKKKTYKCSYYASGQPHMARQGYFASLSFMFMEHCTFALLLDSCLKKRNVCVCSVGVSNFFKKTICVWSKNKAMSEVCPRIHNNFSLTTILFESKMKRKKSLFGGTSKNHKKIENEWMDGWRESEMD